MPHYVGLGYCLIDLNCNEFTCSSLHIERRFLDVFRRHIWFSAVIDLNIFNVGFIEGSGGRIVLKLDGVRKNQELYIPVIVEGFETTQANKVKIQGHGRVGEKIAKYRRDLEKYHEGLKKIGQSRKLKDGNNDPEYISGANVSIALDIYSALEESEEQFDKYDYSTEDEKEKELQEKYKDALKWRGPLLRGLVSCFEGFELRVHSDDHGRHFHVIHKGRRINARFSFPEIQLVDYKNTRNTISSRQVKGIQRLCRNPAISKKFIEEFGKRD